VLKKVEDMKTIWVILVFMLVTAGSSAQVLIGKIIDGESNEALIGATIQAGVDQITTTNSSGEFSLALPLGKSTIQYSFLGYNSQTDTVFFSADQRIDVVKKLYPTSTALDMAVVSAGKFEQKLEELTVSMEVLKPNIIEDKNTTSMEEVLQQAPGVAIVDSEPQIRSGSGFSFGAGSRVMIMVDDLPLVSGDAGRPSWGFFAVENVEQIEIIKGASSVLYGSGALNGVVNIRTAYPRSKPKTKVVVFHGMFSDPKTAEAKYWNRSALQSGSNFLHSKQYGNLDVVLGASVLVDESFKGPYLDSSSVYKPFDPQRADATSRARANLNLRYRSKKISGLDYGLNTNWLIGSSLSTLLWDNTANGLYAPFNNSATRTDQVVGNLDPFINYVTPSGQKHSIKTRWHNLDNDNDTRSADNPEGGANQDNFSDFYYSEYQYQRNFDSLGVKNFNMTAGVMSMFTYSTAQLYAGENEDGKNEARNLAAYLQLDKKIGSRLNLSAGVRLENFRINNQEETKPVFRSGLNYRVAEATFVRASYGQGFRFPTIAEKFITTSVGGVNVFPSLDLQPETSENIEVGLKQGYKIGKFYGYLDLAAFQQTYDNFIEFTFGLWSAEGQITEQLGFRSLNTGRAQVSGLEISTMGKGKIGKVEFQVLAGYTYTNPISLTPDFVYGEGAVEGSNFDTSFNTTKSDSTSDILKYRFQHLGRLDLQSKYKKWTIGASARYNSRTENIDLAFVELDVTGILPTGVAQWMEDRNNGDVVFDARIVYEATTKFKAAFIMNNILNREYALRPLAIESPRLSTVQLTYEFN